MKRAPKIATVDNKASLYIRLKYADKNGYCRCVTCGATHHYKEMHCGHFIKRENMNTRFYEKNLHPQCIRCNKYLSGNLDSYSKFIIDTYGIEEFNYLISQKTKLFTNSKALLLKEMNEYYSKKLKQLTRC